MRQSCLAVPALLLLSSVALADTIKVPQDAATIQAAIDQASPGDEILIKGGIYVENVVIDAKADLTLKAKGKVIVRPVAGVGVLVSSSANIVLDKLRVEQSGSYGIYVVESSGVTISKAQVTDTGDDGIRTDGSTNVTIERCKLELVFGDAISLSGAGLMPTNDSLVSRNKMKTIAGDGVIVNGNDNVVERNFAFETGDDGFQVDFDGAGTGNLFSRNKTVRTGSDGLLAFDTGNTFEDNVVLFPADTGIWAVGSDHVFTGNRIVRPQFAGVLVQADACTVNGTKVTKPGADGLQLEGNDGIFQGNKVAKAGDNGFEVSGVGNTIEDNVAKGSLFFDLFDVAGKGANTYSGNKFKKVFP